MEKQDKGRMTDRQTDRQNMCVNWGIRGKGDTKCKGSWDLDLGCKR